MSSLHRLSENVALLLDNQRQPNGVLELAYWQGILRELQAQLTAPEWSSLTFYLVFSSSDQLAQHLQPSQRPGVTNVLLISDEHQRLKPALYAEGNLIFQAYHDDARFAGLYDGLFALPLGYNGQMELANTIAFADRTNNVFFSGNLHRGRRDIFNSYSYLRHLPFPLQHRLQKLIGSNYDHRYPASYIRFTGGFAQGLQPAEYARFIGNSKIVLTPRGSVSAECFRHYEALKCGCIVVSEPLPANHFFNNSPIIQVKNWREGDRLIKQLLADPARMLALHHASLRWWEEHLAEPAVARYMAARIRPALRASFQARAQAPTLTQAPTPTLVP